MVETSLIIRTNNEERWISKCLKSINRQSYKDFEVVIVDNCSTDHTIKKIKKFNVKKIITIKKYKPGKALNMGFARSIGDFIVIISSHCIPSNNYWLKNLVNEIKKEKILQEFMEDKYL